MVRADPVDLDLPGCPCPVVPVLCLHAAGRWATVEVWRDDLPSAAPFTAAEVFALVGADAWAITCPDCRYVYLGAAEEPDEVWSIPAEVVVVGLGQPVF